MFSNKFIVQIDSITNLVYLFYIMLVNFYINLIKIYTA
jgi:hypothetical protein